MISISFFKIIILYLIIFLLIISGENENETAYTYLNDPDNMKFPDDSIDVTSDVKDMPKIMAESGHSHPNQVQYTIDLFWIMHLST